ncbi:MAG: site-specific DNA-methyltransferase [bacterium]|nr:site-specific DNA-methyltransferase [bacterium]
MPKDYSKLEKGDLLKVIEKLESRKRYGLIWDEEKTKEQFEKESENALPVLKEVKSKEIKTDLAKPTNILIEGDNYHALSVLNYTHQGKIDVIYIDPPYNTGNNDFKYNDSFVEKDDVYRHSKWLSFMSKRLRLAKNLLKDTGVAFISIDDNEASQLKLLCNEIFGEDNLLDVFYVQVRYAGKSLNEKDNFQKLIEQVLIYAKNKYLFSPNKPSTEYDTDVFKFKIIEKGHGEKVILGKKEVTIFKPGQYEIKEEAPNINLLKGTWASGSVLKGNTSGKFFHDYIENRKSLDGLNVLYKVSGIGEDGLGYRYFTGPKKETATKGLFYSGIPLTRRAEIESGNGSQKENPIVNFYDFSGDFGNIRHEGGVDFRSGKKPTRLLKMLINLHKGKEINVLDFFAGSGSTGHAVLSLNEDDNGNRQFILCTNNELNGLEKELREQGMSEKEIQEHGICRKVTYPRVKNVMKGYQSVEGLGGNLKYYKTSFVKNSISRDDLKIRITRECTEMLCLREGIFGEVKAKSDYHIFEQSGRIMGVYYALERDGLEQLKKEMNKMKGEKILYCFTLDPLGLDKKDFVDWDNIKLEPIPKKILDIYEQIYEY